MESIIAYLSAVHVFLVKHMLLNGLVILIVTIILARILYLLTGSIAGTIERRYGVQVHPSVLKIVKSSVWQTVMLVGLAGTIRHFLKFSSLAFLLSDVVKSVVILIWTVMLGQLVWIYCQDRSAKSAGERHALQLIRNISIGVICVNCVILILLVWSVEITPLLASAGIAGLAFALAAKDTLANFFGGLSLFLDRPFKPGDYVVIGSGERGEVIEIGLRSTRILTRDDIMVAIPNSLMANSKIINESAPHPRFRVRIKVGVAYGSDVDEVQAILIRVAQEEKLVAGKPVPIARFRAFGDSALEFELLCWANRPADRGLVTHELNCSIYKEFCKAGIEIPVPQRDVYIHNAHE